MSQLVSNNTTHCQLRPVRPAHDFSAESAIRDLQRDSGLITGEEMHEAIQRGIADLDGQAATSEFRCFENFYRNNSQRMTREAKEVFAIYSRYAAQDRNMGHAGISQLRMSHMLREMRTASLPIHAYHSQHDQYSQLLSGQSQAALPSAGSSSGDIPSPSYQSSSSLPSGSPLPGSAGPVAASELAQIYGDPHIREADGGQFDFQGKAGNIYNLFNDTGISVNALFQSWKGSDTKTTIGQVGISLSGPYGTNEIKVDATRTPSITVNGRTLLPSQKLTLPDGSTISLNIDGRNLTVTTHEGFTHNVILKDIGKPTAHLDYTVRSGAQGVAVDNRMPGGILGETFDADKNRRKASDSQGTGALNGPASLYETSGLFGRCLSTDSGAATNPSEDIPSDNPISPENPYPIETYPDDDLMTRKLKKALEAAMATGNLDLVMLLLAGLETKQANKIATQLVRQIQDLQEKRKQATAIIGKKDSPENEKNQAQADLQGFGTDIGLLQNMLQDVMSQKSEAQSMASNFMKARHDTAMGIIRNMA